MNHYVYENWTRSRAVVHLGSCCTCHEGRGVHAFDSGRHSKWHGPFADRDSAIAFAQSLGKRHTGFCSRCGA